MGYDKNDIANPKDIEQYYSKEEQEKYGVIGIAIKVIENGKWLYRQLPKFDNQLGYWQYVKPLSIPYK